MSRTCVRPPMRIDTAQSTLVPVLVTAFDSTTVRISLPFLLTTKLTSTGEKGLPGTVRTQLPVQSGFTV